MLNTDAQKYIKANREHANSMNVILLLIKALVQSSWGVFCHFHVPHNTLITSLNVGLAIMTIASGYGGIDLELLLRKLYIMIWIIPGTIIACGLVSALFEAQNLALQQAHATPFVPPIDGLPSAYFLELKYYVLSMLIPFPFRIINYFMEYKAGRSRNVSI